MAKTALLHALERFDEADQDGEHLRDHDTSQNLTVSTETSLMSDEEDVDEEEEEDIGFQAALAASRSDTEDTLKQEELELQKAIEASNDVDQDVKLMLDTERAIKMSLGQEKTLKEMRKVQEEEFLRSFSGESPTIPSFDLPSYASSISNITTDGTGSLPRHHPFLSPPTSVILGLDATTVSSQFIFPEPRIPVPSDSGSTVTDIDISPFPLPPVSPSICSEEVAELSSDREKNPLHDSEPGHISSVPRGTPPCKGYFLRPISNPAPETVGTENAPLPEIMDKASISQNQHRFSHRDIHIHTIPIKEIGGRHPIIIPVQGEDEHQPFSQPDRIVAFCSSSRPDNFAARFTALEMDDVPFPEVRQTTRKAPSRQKRSHKRAFSMRSAHMTCVPDPDSTTSNALVQGEADTEPASIQSSANSQKSEDSTPSLFARLAISPSHVPPKHPSTSNCYFWVSDLLADIEPCMSLQLFRKTTRPIFSDQCLCFSCGAMSVHNFQ
ncbi:uncharacterized protein BT62DRAFT_739914 [Guyanagaster necrorhizus]|uniref:Uncharacterized protein n=1 Tax=Guyanagaster necrorhizus TaxID=856835 RepID=A0A9P7VF29_9AGAR|nr:uncharacterized protein BT62DRAFT_739914 [Guyanagaster necrorhizus MCA 3950]KAG7439375.1 hypothetical protein BT62DRAFT_739914 [Guyanagaster necrorhizus MCA 3950]